LTSGSLVISLIIFSSEPSVQFTRIYPVGIHLMEAKVSI
jgi:hypothetical protein